jgi:hypothetical protein
VLDDGPVGTERLLGVGSRAHEDGTALRPATRGRGAVRVDRAAGGSRRGEQVIYPPHGGCAQRQSRQRHRQSRAGFEERWVGGVSSLSSPSSPHVAVPLHPSADTGHDLSSRGHDRPIPGASLQHAVP